MGLRKKDLPYKIKICSNCGERNIGINPEGIELCLTCLSTNFKEIVIDKDTKIHCYYCKKEYTVEQVLQIWITIPFFSINDLSFYDGCKGWD